MTTDSDSGRVLSPTGAKILAGANRRGAIDGHAAALDRLKASGYANKLGGTWYITPAGRAALAEHQAGSGAN